MGRQPDGAATSCACAPSSATVTHRDTAVLGKINKHAIGVGGDQLAQMAEDVSAFPSALPQTFTWPASSHLPRHPNLIISEAAFGSLPGKSQLCPSSWPVECLLPCLECQLHRGLTEQDICLLHRGVPRAQNSVGCDAWCHKCSINI